MSLITRRSSARSLPRTSLGKRGAIRPHCSSSSQNKLLRIFRLVRVYRLLRRYGARRITRSLIRDRAGSALWTLLLMGILVLEFGSVGMLALAAILVSDPQVILLDEPTRGLDYAQKQALADLLLALKRRGKAIVMATHDVELAARCADRVVLLAEGEVVVDGPARQVMSDSQVFASQVNKLFRDPRFLVVEDVLGRRGEGANQRKGE